MKGELRGAVLYRDGYVCQICKEAKATEVDHIWPVTSGGTDDLSNLRAACRACNAAKGDRLFLEHFTPAHAQEAAAYFQDKARAAIVSAAIWRGILETLSEPSETLTGVELAEAAWTENPRARDENVLALLSDIADGFLLSVVSA